jgi:uncharacterized membrane protein
LLGWAYEVILEVVVYRWGFSNRGVLFGPYLPVYGFGAIVFVLTIYRLVEGQSFKRKVYMLPAVFAGCALIATSIELATSYALEAVTGHWPWQTYVDYAINFQGRVALSPSIRFGIGGVLFLYIVQPLLDMLFLGWDTSKLALVITSVLLTETVIVFFFL